MKHIYLLTYHCACNVGAMLQCYGLSTAIRSLGATPIVIDYRPQKIFESRLSTVIKYKSDFFLKYHLKNALLYFRRYFKYLLGKCDYVDVYTGTTETAFCDFMTEMLPLTQRTYCNLEELSQLEENDDFFVVGSDQVWNPQLVNEPEAYFLSFVSNGNKFSYAGSFGRPDLSIEAKNLINNYLSDFKMLSVREQSGVDIINTLIGKNPNLVCDPVFLLTEKQWSQLTYKPHMKEEYILVYQMETNELFNETITELKNREPNLKVVQFDYKSSINYDVYIGRKGPIDFISYIKGCKYMVTNSFHGTAFSLIFKKNAVVIPHKSLNERISSLMKIVGLNQIKGRYYTDKNSYKMMESLIKQSILYLQTLCKQ